MYGLFVISEVNDLPSGPTLPATCQRLGRAIAFGKARCCEQPDRITGSRFVAAPAHIEVAVRVHMFSASPLKADIAQRSRHVCAFR